MQFETNLFLMLAFGRCGLCSFLTEITGNRLHTTADDLPYSSMNCLAVTQEGEVVCCLIVGGSPAAAKMSACAGWGDIGVLDRGARALWALVF